MFHRDDDAPRTGHQVHRAAHAFDHFAGDHPVREVALLVHFHRAEHAQVNVTAANHGERIGARKIRSAGKFADRFLAGVDEVSIFLPFDRVRSDAQHAVLTLQDDVHAGGNVVGDEGGQPDAEVHVEPVAQFAGDALDDAFAFVNVFGWFGFDWHGAFRDESSMVVRRQSFASPSPGSMPLSRATND